jgi:hypothetical protein
VLCPAGFVQTGGGGWKGRSKEQKDFMITRTARLQTSMIDNFKYINDKLEKSQNHNDRLLSRVLERLDQLEDRLPDPDAAEIIEARSEASSEEGGEQHEQQ